MSKLDLGVFLEQGQADQALDDLRAAGFDSKRISVITKERVKTAEEESRIPGGIATGATVGGVAGLLMGAGAINIPGLGALLIGGPIATALGLTGMAAAAVSGAVTGALAGGLVGALVDLGVPKDKAEDYERQVREGAVILAVPLISDNEESEAKRIMRDNGASQVDTIETSRVL